MTTNEMTAHLIILGCKLYPTNTIDNANKERKTTQIIEYEHDTKNIMLYSSAENSNYSHTQEIITFDWIAAGSKTYGAMIKTETFNNYDNALHRFYEHVMNSIDIIV